MPDAGATIAALQAVTGRTVEVMTGKPSQWMGKVVLERLQSAPEHCVLVGDRRETDVAFGKRLGMTTIEVQRAPRQGSADNPKQLPQPDFVIPSLCNLPEVLAGMG
ncbi:MAG: HAD hydrolase-like protein [Thermaerobacter sp.]|nr:HAD hydrolase-like protein [Thermaerobacter sp.]